METLENLLKRKAELEQALKKVMREIRDEVYKRSNGR
jgi:hypothetical protein